MLFVDTDTIFLRDAHDLWLEFNNMNSEQFVGTTIEYGHWYLNSAVAPDWGYINGYRAVGVNAGKVEHIL